MDATGVRAVARYRWWASQVDADRWLCFASTAQAGIATGQQEADRWEPNWLHAAATFARQPWRSVAETTPAIAELQAMLLTSIDDSIKSAVDRATERGEIDALRDALVEDGPAVRSSLVLAAVSERVYANGCA